MSLINNRINLTEILNKVKALPIFVDTSDANATASDMLSDKTAYVDGEKITGNIPTRTSSNLSASGATVTVPAGHYASNVSKSVATATQATPNISVSSSGLITASATQSEGYVSEGTKRDTEQLPTQAAKTVTPTTAEQTAVDKGVYTTGVVKVGAIPSNYKVLPELTKECPAEWLMKDYQLIDGDGNIVTGTMPNSTVTTVITSKTQKITIPKGYHGGNGTVSIQQSEQDKLIPENIRSGIRILNVDGAYNGESLPTLASPASAENLLEGKQLIDSSGKIVEGTMPDKTASYGINLKTLIIDIPKGYHNGNGKVTITDSEKDKIIPENIKSGIDILGVSGSFTSDATAAAGNIESGKTAYANGVKIVGTLTFRTIYTGSSAPSTNIGNEGDIFIVGV